MFSLVSWCVTKGQGCCNSPKLTCANYIGDDDACQSYFGYDGNCVLADTTNFKAKKCQNASTSLTTDEDCKIYQKGCIKSGKGYIQRTKKHLCSTQSRDNIACVGYIGSDGVCEENGAFNVDELCKQIKVLVKQMVKIVLPHYQLIILIKEMSLLMLHILVLIDFVKERVLLLKPLVYHIFVIKLQIRIKTMKILINIKLDVNTGKGCIVKNNLKSCTTYDGDSNSYQSRVGSEEKYTWKSGTKNVARYFSQYQSSL